MEKKITPYKDSRLNKKAQVEQMFDNISGGYDGLNRVISLGADTRWRKKVINLVLDHKPQSILDIATGTGDLAISFAQRTQSSILLSVLFVSLLLVGEERKRVVVGALLFALSFSQPTKRDGKHVFTSSLE